MKYNYKESQLTQYTEFDNTYELLMDMLDAFKSLRRYEFLSVYTNTVTALKIVNWMIVLGYDLNELYIDMLNRSGNDMIILNIGYDSFVSVESMYNGNTCKFSEAAITYVHETTCKTNVLLTHERNEENILCFCLKKELGEEVVY